MNKRKDDLKMISPYGEAILVNSISKSAKELEELRNEAAVLKSIVVHDRFLSDCEMLSVGAFTPIEGFMDKDQISSVLKSLTLPNGLVWGIPIVLLVSEDQASNVKTGEKVTLLDSMKRAVAVMKVRDKFKFSKDNFCNEVFKTTDISHPGVKMIKTSPELGLAGKVELLSRPKRSGVFNKYCLDPLQTRSEFRRRGWSTVVAFQTRNPLHRGHEYLIKSALKQTDGALIHPLIGETKIGDVPAKIRMKCYEVLVSKYFEAGRAILSALPNFMRYAGPREALHHAIVRRNYGCTHFIIGRDHAGVGNFYGNYEAQELVLKYQKDIGIKPVIFENVFFCRRCRRYATSGECSHAQKEHLHLSGTKVRDMLKNGIRPPAEFSRKEVIDILMDWAKGNKKRNN